MADYRAYVLDKNDHIIKRHDFEAESTTAALEVARQYAVEHDVEVWHRTYVIGRVKRKA